MPGICWEEALVGSINKALYLLNLLEVSIHTVKVLLQAVAQRYCLAGWSCTPSINSDANSVKTKAWKTLLKSSHFNVEKKGSLLWGTRWLIGFGELITVVYTDARWSQTQKYHEMIKARPNAPDRCSRHSNVTLKGASEALCSSRRATWGVRLEGRTCSRGDTMSPVS